MPMTPVPMGERFAGPSPERVVASPYDPGIIPGEARLPR